MIRVVLPAHLRTLARVGNDEVHVQVTGQPTLGAVLDAIEASYPMLRGTIRDYGTEKRRPFVTVLRLRTGSLARTAQHAAAGRCCQRRGAVSRCRRHGRRMINHS